VRTDSVGEAIVNLMPGRYRIRSMTPVEREEGQYTWDVEASVDRAYNSLVVSLNKQNASVGGVIAAAPPPNTTVIQAQRFGVTPTNPAPVGKRALQPGDPGYKDSGMAVLFSLLIVGGGHFYSGETTTGVAFLLGTAVLAGVAIASCNYDTCDEGVATGALVGAGVLAIVSIFDGAAAAGRSNRRGLRVTGIGPLEVRPVRSGLALAFTIR
jgi:hypothetical protein